VNCEGVVTGRRPLAAGVVTTVGLEVQSVNPARLHGNLKGRATPITRYRDQGLIGATQTRNRDLKIDVSFGPCRLHSTAT
jgi:hypothetical protein